MNFITISDIYQVLDSFHSKYALPSDNGIQFERCIAESLQYQGFTSVTLTPRSGDKGVDIKAYKNDILYLFQCKCDIKSKADKNAPLEPMQYILDKDNTEEIKNNKIVVVFCSVSSMSGIRYDSVQKAYEKLNIDFQFKKVNYRSLALALLQKAKVA